MDNNQTVNGVDVYVLMVNCWSCDSETKIVWPRDDNINDFGDELSESNNTNVEYRYNKTKNEKEFTNVCENCDITQGNSYVREKIVDKFSPYFFKVW